MSNLSSVTIQTERLKLVPVSIDFVEDIFHEFTAEITEYMYPKPPSTIDDTISFIKESQENISKGEELVVVILDQSSDEFLGVAGLHKIYSETPELGIWLKKDAHGHKYGREAIAGLKKYADENIKHKYLTYPVDKRNIASRKIAESLGGVVEAEYQKTNLSGKVLDEVEYRIYPNR